MNFSHKASFVLLVIVTLGFLLRTFNLTIGFPILYMSADEASYHLSALLMIAEKTPFTTGNYGPLGAYIQIPFLLLASFVMLLFGKVDSLKDIPILIASNEGYFMFVPRVISAMFGTLIIIAVYKLSKELFGKWQIAMLSSLLSALSLNLVFISHQARALAPMIFFAMLSAHMALLASKNTKRFVFYATNSAILASISFGFHQFGGLIFLLVFLISKGKLSLKTYLKKMIIPFIVFLTLIFIFNYLSLGTRFFSILNPANMSDDVELVNHGFLADFSVSDAINFLEKLFLSDPVICLLVIIFFCSKKYNSSVNNPFKIFILLNLLFSILVFPGFIRYFLIAFCFFPVIGGAVFYDLIKRFRYNLIFIMISIIAISLNSLYFNYLIAQKPTFHQMRQWVDSNIPPNTPLVATSYRDIGYVPSLAAANLIREEKPMYYSKASVLIGDEYLPNVRNIVYASELSKPGETKASYTKKALELSGAKIIIDSYLESDKRLLTNSANLKLGLIAHFSSTEGKIYDDVIPEFYSDPAFLFPFFKIERPGPYFDILKVM